jgi:hypothetical protein
MIKIIHQIWVGSPIPENFRILVNKLKLKNPNYDHILWDKNMFIEEFPESRIFFELECVPAFLADYMRLRILNKYGGWYIDVDYEAFISLDSLKFTNKLIVCESYLSKYKFMTGFFYTTKSYDFKDLIKYLPDTVLMGKFDDFLKDEINYGIISSELVGINGSAYKEQRLRSFYSHKNFNHRLIKNNKSYSLIHKSFVS